MVFKAAILGLASIFIVGMGHRGETASRLTADEKLAHYAEYYAASMQVRELGRQITAKTEQRAAELGIRLPAEMCQQDRDAVQRLENLQGDDFDSAYLDMVK